MVSVGVLLKLVAGGQAIIYKMIEVEIYAVKVEEIGSIGNGKMAIHYKNRIESHIFQSDIGITYTFSKSEEMSTIMEILYNSMVEPGF